MPVSDATVAARCQGGRAPAPRQDEHGRVRHGLVDRELGLRADPQPVGHEPRARRLRRRLGGGRGRGPGAVGARLRHGRLDQAAGRAHRHRRPAPDLRHGLALRRRRLRLQPRPGRPGDEDRARLRAPLPHHRRPRPARLDHRRAAGADRAARARGPARHPRRRAARAQRGGGDRARRARCRGGARSSSPASWAPRSASASCRARSSTGCPATT